MLFLFLKGIRKLENMNFNQIWKLSILLNKSLIKQWTLFYYDNYILTKFCLVNISKGHWNKISIIFFNSEDSYMDSVKNYILKFLNGFFF